MRGSKPGERRGGRQRGTPNKMTSVLKDAILKAAENAGGGDIVDYLTTQAKENPGPFMTLLGKVLPLQIGGDPENPLIARRVRDLTDEELTAIIISGQNGGHSQ
ncbi:MULTISPECIES: hypothetical protein [unclassified Rhizobium]|uniref:hypothetical protein n=1 Tax=unclassified Rhizobium TaxID=2613769 RepID=UPI00192A480F|nr:MULTISPECIES: hypothetical protein [unclassified Rhizobium]